MGLIHFYDHISKEKELESLWEVVRTVLLLSHGQAQVERGSSTSRELMDVNMKQRTLVAKRAKLWIMSSTLVLLRKFTSTSP